MHAYSDSGNQFPFFHGVGGMSRKAFKSAALLAAPCGVTDHV